ncbi:hypothetical protein BH10PSE14_BH10PSE14_25130 [soil metagenome]
MDQVAITVMVEDFWRSFIPVSFAGDQQTAVLIVNRFQQQIDQMAAIMPTGEAESWLSEVEAVRERLFNEYNANPAALKQRLGIPDPQPVRRGGARQRQGLGELAVRTAVRATVWETIISLFRAAR